VAVHVAAVADPHYKSRVIGQSVDLLGDAATM
jgi:hypothetical protein